MAYQKQNFVDGQPLSAAELNRMEEGIAAAMEAGGGNVPGGPADLTGYAKEAWVQENYQPKGDYPLRNELPSVPVQSVNGKTGAVSLGAEDVGARPNSWTPTAAEVGALPNTYTPPNQTAQQVGADPAGTADNAVSGHNSSADAHADIRLQLTAINDRLKAFFDSDDQTLDELSEIVAYITSNKSLIDAITTSKVSVLDIVNDLVTNVPAKPLSAAQGVVLKTLIDNLSTGKLDASKLTEAINTALAQAKESGEFDGPEGQRGTGILNTTTGIASYTTAVGGVSPKYRILLSTLKTQAAVNEVLVGDTVRYSTFLYPVIYVDSEYAYMTTRITIQGTAGTSVTVESVTESSESGGSNVVAFSDNKTVTVKNGKDGYTPVRGTDYWTEVDKAEFSEYIASELAKRGQLKPEFAESEEWLKANGDTTNLYVLPDGFIYAYMLTEVESEPLFTNMIDGAEITTGHRYSLSGKAFKAQTGCDAVVFQIPSSESITIRLHDCGRNQSYPQIYGGTSSTAFTKSFVDDARGWNTDSNGDQYATFTNSAGCTYVVVMMETVDTSKAIITVNEEIKWSEGGAGHAWANTGHAFVPADYEPRILKIEEDVSEQAKQISNLEKKVENINADASLEDAYARIKNWNYPIYEDAPVFLLETNKPAMGATEPMATAGIYAKYDTLMAANSHYITRENCGMASDGTTPIYAYHFKEPDPRSPYQGMWREKKPVILVCSGVHQEWAGIYCMYYAMEEITTNPKLLDLRRNVHFIIFPMLNPTAAMDAEYKMRNPDGIQVHHNFEVGHGENGAVQGDRYYGGETPLSIPETQYFDKLMNRYKDDLSCVLSCHNNVVDEKYGTSFIWCSCATYFMTNLGNRLAEKMSSAWLEKHGDALVEGIRWANNYALEQAATGTHAFFKEGFTTAQPEWDLRIGWAGLSGSGGTEYRHGMKYGVHGINVEVCPRCVLDKNYNAEYTSNVMTMGAETYVNFFRTFMAAYDPKDKKDYAPNLPWSE